MKCYKPTIGCGVYENRSCNECPYSKPQEAECPVCHGTGKIGTTDWLTKHLSAEQLAKEKAEAIAEHERSIKQDIATTIFSKIYDYMDGTMKISSVGLHELILRIKKELGVI